jgi:hypothetical protein
MSSLHPNFPVGLAIAPSSQQTGDDLEAYQQREAIEQYGIAGRIWQVRWNYTLISIALRLMDDLSNYDVGMLLTRCCRT